MFPAALPRGSLDDCPLSGLDVVSAVYFEDPSAADAEPVAAHTGCGFHPCFQDVAHTTMFRIRYSICGKDFFGTRQQKRQEVKAIQVWKEQPDTWGRCGSSGDSAPVRGAGASCGSAFDGSRPQRLPIRETGDAN